jgi:Ca2+-binding EF-hand superfamily protein
MRELIAQPSTPNLIKMLFKMMDKDNSKTLEQAEVCEFTKKLVNIIIRNIKNSVHILVKAVSAVLGSQAADKVFEILDQDRDGKLSPEECTMNFAGPMLMAVQSLAAAAPFLNEVRAKDHEIAFLKARLASLGGDMSDFAPLALPEVEISQDEYDDLVLICSKGIRPENFHIITHEKSSGMRAALSKIMQMVSKLLARTFIKLTQFTMAESYDPESFFKAFKVMFTENMMELKGLLAPLYKVMPRGDRVIAITDKIHAKIQSGDFDKEIRDYSGSLFKMLDQDDDGKICPADAAIYTDLFFAPCLGDESAKKKFMAIFNNLDLAKTGSLSKDEISAFVTKFVNAYACAILVGLSFIDAAICEQADHEIKAIMEAYVKAMKEKKFREVSTFDISEVNALITEYYVWLEYYVWSIAPSAEPQRVRERFTQKYGMPFYM